MKPLERSGFVDLWVLLQQNTSGQFNFVSTNTSPFGIGMYVTEKDAQHAQTIELLKGNRVQVYHLEWPIN